MPPLERSAVFDFNGSCAEPYFDYLSREECTWLSGFQNRARREQSACVRACLKHLFLLQMDSYFIDRMLRISEEDFARFPVWLYRQASVLPEGLQAAPGLRWCGAPCDGVRVSLSHSKTTCVASLSAGRGVGIDVESVDAKADGFYVDYYSEAEREWVASSANSREDSTWLFAVLWSLKECALKTAAFGKLSIADLGRLEITRFPQVEGGIASAASSSFALRDSRFPVEMSLGAKSIGFDCELAKTRGQIVTVLRQIHSGM
jgi:phosphopantetheinyl transferase (holo-ACP synthase)